LYSEKCQFTNFHHLINDVYEVNNREIYRGEERDSDVSLINQIHLQSPRIDNESFNDQQQIDLIQSQKSLLSQKLIQSSQEVARINTEIKSLLEK
jgi:hypothetical protein